MAHDDDKPESGDDPWAGLEAENLPDLGSGFAFSFDDDAAATEPAAAEPTAADSVADDVGGDDASGPGGDDLDFGAFTDAEAPADELAPIAAFAEEPPADLDSPFDGATAPEADLAFESLLGEDASAAMDEPEVPVAPAAEGAADADIDAWLSGAADGDGSASSVLATGDYPEVDAAGDAPDFAAGASTVSIGTGTSGIASPSGIAAFDDAAAAASGDDADPFAGLTSDDGDWPAAEGGQQVGAADGSSGEAGDDIFSFMGPSAGEAPVAPATDAGPPADDDAAADGFGGGFDVGTAALAAGAAATAGDAKPTAGKGKRTAPPRAAAPRKKKPSVIGQLVGVVLGGAMAIPVTFAILIWGFGRDPFNLTPMVPESVAFLLPAKFRPASATTIPNAPSLDDIVGTPAGADDATPAAPDEPAPMEPEPGVEPEPTDVAAVDPAPAPGDGEADPLMNLLEESTPATEPPAPVEPPPPPEPEPLDLEKLGVAVAEVTAGLEAVAAVDDPSDPVRRRLLAKWYLSLAGYAEELAALERLASETGRPFEPAVEQAEAIRSGLADHPQLLAELSRLTRDWIDYTKRPRDGIVTSATFVAAKRVGPYWRSQVSLVATATKPARDLVVLTRAEPAVAPGDEVVITGLAVDGDTLWATDLRAAGGGAAFPGL